MSDILEAKTLNLWYGEHHALHDVSLSVPEKSIMPSSGPPAAANPPSSRP